MKKLLILFSFYLFFVISGYAQNTNTVPCRATLICPGQVSGTPVAGTAFGVVGGCTSLSQRPSLFYTVFITSPGEFTFIINPTQATDYDWAVWKNIDCNSASTTSPDRISFDAPGPNDTGMTTTEPLTDFCEDAVSGNGLLRGINVVQGDVLLIAINFYTNNNIIPTFNLFVNGVNGGGGNAGFSCCPNSMDPNFTMSATTCVNGTMSITATATQAFLPNHQWGLMETSVAGNTSDATTLNGGASVQPAQGGSIVTFTGLNPLKNYYIKHGVWCGALPWQENRKPVAKSPQNLNSDFTMSATTCANGTLKITVNASDTSIPNHQWGLMETSVAGNTSDATTLNGGVAVQPLQGGSSYTFTGLNPNKHYYIKHGVWNCSPWQETRKAVAKPPQNLNSDFVMSATTCVNGTLTVTVTASDTSIPNHQWGLMETSVAGNTSDATTLNGGASVQPTQVGVSYTFTGLNPSKHYYIKHGVWNCSPWQETRKPVAKLSLNYTLNDVNNNQNDTYCIGTDVFLNGSSVNTYGGGYYIDLWDVTGGGLTWLSAQGVNGWATGNPNWVNITNLFENDIQHPVIFQPNRVYRVKLAVNSPCGWIETTKDFNYICCESSSDASFGLLSYTMPTGDIYISLMSDNNLGGQIISEQWCIYEAPNGNMGPYYLISCDMDPNLIILPPKKCYYITHRITTVCGEACSGQTICNTGCSDDINTNDCDELTQPTNLSCSNNFGTIDFTWDAVPGAISYLLLIDPYDPECCPFNKELPFSLEPIFVNTNFYSLNLNYICFSWRVIAICEDGTYSIESEKKCSCNKSRSIPLDSKPNMNPTEVPILAKVYPNPAKDNVNILIETIEKTVEFYIEIYDMKGMKVKTFGKNKTINGKSDIKWSVIGLPKGIYNVNIKTISGDQTNKKLIID